MRLATLGSFVTVAHVVLAKDTTCLPLARAGCFIAPRPGVFAEWEIRAGSLFVGWYLLFSVHCDSPASFLCSCGVWSPGHLWLWLHCVCGNNYLDLWGIRNYYYWYLEIKGGGFVTFISMIPKEWNGPSCQVCRGYTCRAPALFPPYYAQFSQITKKHIFSLTSSGI